MPSRGELERFEIFKEMNYVLKDGGKVIIDLVHKVDFKDFESFKKNVELFGFKVVDDFTGSIQEGDRYKSKVITLEKISHLGNDFSVNELVDDMNREQINGFKFQDVKDKLKNQRQIITNFKIGEKQFDIQFNATDRKIYQEEQTILQKGEELKSDHGGIEGIPKEEVINNLFIRYRPKNSYRLFRRLRVSEGGVVIK